MKRELTAEWPQNQVERKLDMKIRGTGAADARVDGGGSGAGGGHKVDIN